MKRKEITGRRVGKWTVISFAGIHPAWGHSMWVCKCDCGTLRTRKVTAGTMGCGCLRTILKTRHGHSRRLSNGGQSHVYGTWKSMLVRCTNPSAKSFSNYGARGIDVCESWHRFENFLADMGEPPSPVHSIDRINSDGNYEPTNCRWATKKVQANNRRTNVVIERSGKSLTVAQWAEYLGLQGCTWRQVKEIVTSMA